MAPTAAWFTQAWGAMANVDYTWLDSHAEKSPVVFRHNETSVPLGVLYAF